MTIFCLLLIHIFDFAPHKVGGPLFVIITLLGLFEILGVADNAANLLAEERRDKTLALLFGTGISSTEVLVGKIFAILIAPLSRLLLVIPCLLIVTMMKAATIQVSLAVFVALCVLLALSLSLYLLASLVFKERTSGAIAANLFLALLLGFFPLVNALNKNFGFDPIHRFWTSLNPAIAPWLLFEHPETNAELGYVYLSIASSALLALIFFFTSAQFLSRIWQDQVSGVRSPTLGKFLESFRTRQKRRARQSLETNPYEWLIHRDFQPALIVWSTFAGLAVLWLLAFWQWGGAWLIPMNFWITLVLLGLITRWMTHYLGARQIAIDRSTGTLELILTSPLSVGDLVAAQQSSIRTFVRPIYAFLAALHLIFFVLGFLFHPMLQGALINYIFISALVALFGPWFNFQGHWGPFWIALNTGRPMFALTRYVFGGMNRMSFFWMFFLAFRVDRLPSAPTGSLGETIFVGAIVLGLFLWYIFYRFCWTTDWNASQKIRNLAIEHMRAIAAEPVPDLHDPRVQSWDHTKPLFDDPNDLDDESDPEIRDERSRQRILEQR